MIYEPNNEEALSFYPLIQEKIKQGKYRDFFQRKSNVELAASICLTEVHSNIPNQHTVSARSKMLNGIYCLRATLKVKFHRDLRAGHMGLRASLCILNGISLIICPNWPVNLDIGELLW